MANCSIPSSTPAIGRTSTPLSRRSRKQNKLTRSYLCLADRCGSRLRKRRQAAALQSTLCAQKTQSAIRNPQSAVRRVKGAWWSSRSSKPLSVPHTRDRGRFDSYPLRHSIFDFRFHHARQELFQSKIEIRKSKFRKGGDYPCRVSK